MTSSAALEWSARLLGFGIATSSAELLVSARWMFETGLLSAPGQTRLPLAVYGLPAFRGLVLIRLLAASLMIVAPGTGGPLVPGLLLLTLIAQQLRFESGVMAAEQIQTLTLAGLTAAQISGSEPMRAIALGFIALHAAIAYFTAGYHKLVSPHWRNGAAIRSIFNTHSFGNEWASRLLSRSPLLCQTIAWSVIGWECLFPLAITRFELAVAFTAAGFLFHLGTAVGMKLSNFLWAFPPCYPAVLFWALR